MPWAAPDFARAQPRRARGDPVEAHQLVEAAARSARAPSEREMQVGIRRWGRGCEPAFNGVGQAQPEVPLERALHGDRRDAPRRESRRLPRRRSSEPPAPARREAAREEHPAPRAAVLSGGNKIRWCLADLRGSETTRLAHPGTVRRICSRCAEGKPTRNKRRAGPRRREAPHGLLRGHEQRRAHAGESPAVAEPPR